MSTTLATGTADMANSVYGGTDQLIFEGVTTADAYETIITPTDATADRTHNPAGCLMVRRFFQLVSRRPLIPFGAQKNGFGDYRLRAQPPMNLKYR